MTQPTPSGRLSSTAPRHLLRHLPRSPANCRASAAAPCSPPCPPSPGRLAAWRVMTARRLAGGGCTPELVLDRALNLPARLSADADLAAAHAAGTGLRAGGPRRAGTGLRSALQDPQALYALSLEFERMGAYHEPDGNGPRDRSKPANLVGRAHFPAAARSTLRFRELITDKRSPTTWTRCCARRYPPGESL